MTASKESAFRAMLQFLAAEIFGGCIVQIVR